MAAQQFDITAANITQTVYNKEAVDTLVGGGVDISGKMDKVPSAGSNDIAIFDNAGQVVDSGKTVAQVDLEIAAKLSTVAHNTTLSGNGTSAQPLGVVGSAIDLSGNTTITNINTAITNINTEITDIEADVQSLQALGKFLGSVATDADIASFDLTGKNPVLDDYITVQADSTASGEPTRYRLTQVSPPVWTFDFVYTTGGQYIPIITPVVANHVATTNTNGMLKDSGVYLLRDSYQTVMLTQSSTGSSSGTTTLTLGATNAALSLNSATTDASIRISGAAITITHPGTLFLQSNSVNNSPLLVSNVDDPQEARDATNKQYVDGKAPHFYATEDEALAASTANPTWLCFYPES